MLLILCQTSLLAVQPTTPIREIFWKPPVLHSSSLTHNPLALRLHQQQLHTTQPVYPYSPSSLFTSHSFDWQKSFSLNWEGKTVVRWSLFTWDFVFRQEKPNSGNLCIWSVLPAWLLFEHVDDVLDQQVPLQAVNTVPVQHHLVSAGRASEAAAGRQRAAPRWKVRVWSLWTVTI